MSILGTADPIAKAAASRAAVAAWQEGSVSAIGRGAPPSRPARPDRPELLPPRAMARRSHRGERGRIALLHALAHIELNAIDLAWDLIARFSYIGWPQSFYAD